MQSNIIRQEIFNWIEGQKNSLSILMTYPSEAAKEHPSVLKNTKSLYEDITRFEGRLKATDNYDDFIKTVQNSKGGLIKKISDLEKTYESLDNKSTLKGQTSKSMMILRECLTHQLLHPNVNSSPSLIKIVKDFISRIDDFMDKMDKTKDINSLIQNCTLHEEINKWNQSCAIQSPNILSPEGLKKILGGIEKITIGYDIMDKFSKDDA